MSVQQSRLQVSVFLYKEEKPQSPAVLASAFGRAPENSMSNSFDIRGKSRCFPCYVRRERQKPKIATTFTTRKQCTVLKRSCMNNINLQPVPNAVQFMSLYLYVHAMWQSKLKNTGLSGSASVA